MLNTYPTDSDTDSDHLTNPSLIIRNGAMTHPHLHFQFIFHSSYRICFSLGIGPCVHRIRIRIQRRSKTVISRNNFTSRRMEIVFPMITRIVTVTVTRRTTPCEKQKNKSNCSSSAGFPDDQASPTPTQQLQAPHHPSSRWPDPQTPARPCDQHTTDRPAGPECQQAQGPE